MGLFSRVKSFFTKKTTSTSTDGTAPMSYSPYATGGMSTPTGEVLVTPSGTVVGSAYSGGGSGGGGGSGTPIQTLASGDVLTDTGQKITQKEAESILKSQAKNLTPIQKFEASKDFSPILSGLKGSAIEGTKLAWWGISEPFKAGWRGVKEVGKGIDVGFDKISDITKGKVGKELYIKPIKLTPFGLKRGGFTFAPEEEDFSVSKIEEKIKKIDESSLTGQKQKAEKELLELQNKYTEQGKIDTIKNEWTDLANERDIENYNKKLQNYNKRKEAIESLGFKDVIFEGVKDLSRDLFIDLAPTTAGESFVAGVGAYGGYKAGVVGLKAISQIPKVITIPADVYFAGIGTKSFLEPTLEPKERVMGLGVAGLSGLGLIGDIVKGSETFASVTSPSRAKKVEKIISGDEILRNRATIILKDDKGKILYHLDKNTGSYILPGGGIDKGESALKSAQRELFEETGLKDIKLKKSFDFLSKREKNIVFEGTLPKGIDIKDLKPQAKEVLGFKFISPKRYTGKTQLRPFGEPVSVFDRTLIRAEDLQIGSLSTYGKNLEQNALYIFPPEEQFIRKGKQVFLKERVKKPTITSPSSWIDYISGKKAGQFKEFQDVPPIVVEFGSRYDIPFSKLKPLKKGEFHYVRGSPSKVIKETEYLSKDIPKGIGDISVSEGFKVKKKFMKRGEKLFFFHPPTTTIPKTSEGYLGASYTGLFKKPKRTYELGIGKGTEPTIQIIKEQVGKKGGLKFSKKAIFGKEAEVGAEAGTKFVVEDELKTYLAGRKVRVEKLKLEKIKKGELSQENIDNILKDLSKMSKEKKIRALKRIEKETGQRYYSQAGLRPVTPYEFAGDISMVGKLSKELKNFTRSKTKYKVPDKKEKIKDSVYEYNLPKKLIHPKSPTSYKYDTPINVEPYKYDYPSKPEKGYGYTEPPSIKKLIPRTPSKRRQLVKKVLPSESYNVFVKEPKTKRYVKITKKPIGLKEARALRNYGIDQSVSRQGYIKRVKQKPNPLMYDIPLSYSQNTQNKFRTFRQRKGKRTKLQPERVIEKSKYLIDTRGEKQQLDIFKVLAQREKKRQNKNQPVGLQFA